MNKLLQTKSSHLNSERELNKRTREIEQLYAAGIKLGNSLDLSTIYDNICSIVEDVMECDDFFVSTYSKEDNLIRCCYMKHQGKLMDVESLPPLILNPENLGTQSDVIKTGKSLIITDLENAIKKSKKKYFIDSKGKIKTKMSKDENPDKSALMVPIRINNEVVGVIQVFSANKNAYSKYHLKYLEALSPQIAAAIANANLYIKAQKEIEERKKVERTLQLTQFSVDKSADAITWVNMDGKFININDSACELFGTSKEELLNSYVWDFDINSTKESWSAFKKNLEITGKDLSESVIRNKKVGFIPIEILANYIVYEGREYIVAFVRNISVRKKAQVGLQESERRYRDLFEHMVEGYAYCKMIYDDNRPIDFEYISVNKRFEILTGLNDVTGKKVSEAIPGFTETDKELLSIYSKVASTGEHQKFEAFVNAMNMWFSISVYSPEKGYFVAVFDVITERKNAENELKVSEVKYRQLFESIPIPVYVADVETLKILSVNEAAIKVYGYSKDEWLKLTIKDLRPLEEVDRLLEDVYREYSNFRGEWIHRKKDGTLINVEITRYSILYEGKKAFVVLINDVTEKKRAHEEVLKTKEQLQNIFDNLNNVFWSIDLVNNKILQVSPACFRVFGRTQEEFYNNPGLWFDVIYPEDKPQVKLFNASFFEKESYDDKYRIIHKNGEIRWVEHSIKCTRDENKKLIRLDGITTDVTERIKAEEALKQSEERFKQVAENADEWIWEVDSNGLYTYASPVVEKILGYRHDEIVGKKYFYDFFEPETKEFLKNAAFEVFKNKQIFKNLINVNLHRNGKQVVLETNGSPIVDQNGNLLGYRGADTDVTEKIDMEEKLKLTQYSVENASDAVIWIDRNGNFISANDAVCKLTNLDKNTLLRLNVGYFAKDYTPETWDIFWNMLVDKKTYNGEYAIEFSKDKILQFDILANYIKYGEKEYIIVFGRDITERKKADESVKISEENFRAIFENNSASILIIERDTTISMVNDMFCQNTGYTKEEIIGTSWIELIPPNDRDRLINMNRKRLINPDDAPNKYEFSFYNKNREIRKGLVSVSMIPINGKIIASFVDISDRKKAEEALLESELKYRTLVEGMNEGILMGDLNEKILFVNDQLCKITGYTKEELVGKIGFDVLLKEENRQFIIEKNIRRFKGLEDKYEMQLKHKSGKLVWVEISASPAYDIKGNIVGSIAVVTDISDKKYAESNLRKLSSAVEQSFASVIITDVNGNIEYINPHFSYVTGYFADEVLGKNPRFLQSGTTEPEVYKNLWDTVTSGNEWRGELLNKKKSGELYWENISISPVKNVKGEITNYLGIFEDVTEKKFKDEQLRDSLKEKEVMLKEIHHRVKNNLQIISSLLKLQSTYIKDPQVLEYFRVSQSRIRSMALIHQQLYNSQSLSKINFRDYLSSLTKELTSYNVSSKNILINVNVEELFFNIETAIPCGLMVNELISNSLKHAFNGCSKGKIDIEMFEAEKNRYTLIVRDDGVGLPDDFDLNKPHSLGIELITSLVDQLEGTIKMENHNGTECKINFSELNYNKRI